MTSLREHNGASRCRLEVLKTNPVDEPDMSKWETELVFRLAG